MRQMQKLSAARVRNEAQPGRYGDGGGLWLQVAPGGTKSWIFRYMRNGREREMGLGPVHTIGLGDARERAQECRKLLLDGRDPIDARNQRRMEARLAEAGALTFKDCAVKYIAAHGPSWRNPKHRAQWGSTLMAYAYPTIGGDPFSSTFIEAANGVIDMDAARKAARGAHIPTAVLMVLLIYLVITAGVMGYVLRAEGRGTAAFVLLLLALSLTLVIDIDRPGRGMVRESQLAMEQLHASLAAQPPEVFDRWREDRP